MTIDVVLSGTVGRQSEIDVAFALPMRGVTALLGPSGSGKTTVLRALAGLDRIPGTIRFGDEVWQGPGRFVPASRRRTAMVFQGAGLLPHLSVGQNLDYAERRAPPGPFSRDDIIDWTAIGPLLDRRPARLSGGEAQRAAVARALLSQPRLLLMDEPLSALDSEARVGLLGHLEALFAGIAVPVVYVTHDETEAARIAAQVLRLRNGSLDRQSPGTLP